MNFYVSFIKFSQYFDIILCPFPIWHIIWINVYRLNCYSGQLGKISNHRLLLLLIFIELRRSARFKTFLYKNMSHSCSVGGIESLLQPAIILVVIRCWITFVKTQMLVHHLAYWIAVSKKVFYKYEIFILFLFLIS